jgi:hypothetical protein
MSLIIAECGCRYVTTKKCVGTGIITPKSEFQAAKLCAALPAFILQSMQFHSEEMSNAEVGHLILKQISNQQHLRSSHRFDDVNSQSGNRFDSAYHLSVDGFCDAYHLSKMDFMMHIT